jgi:hypothetical protein
VEPRYCSVLLSTSPTDTGDSGLLLLTVDEAARVLRIGRTKAYALTREYRDTGGRSGIPVVDFGDVLRVPAARIAAKLGVTAADVVAAVRGSHEAPAERPAPPEAVAARPDETSRSRTPRRRPASATAQLSLLDADGPPSVR